jgi:hypothetical protein
MRSSSRSCRADSPMPELGDQLEHLIGAPLQPPPDGWRDARQAADLAHARRLHEQGADRYWEWRRLLRDIVTTGAPTGDISALDDTDALKAVQESVTAGPWTRRST